MLVADSEIILAIDTSFPAVDVGPIAIHDVPAASDAPCSQEKTTEEAFEIKSQNLEVSLATTWPLPRRSKDANSGLSTDAPTIFLVLFGARTNLGLWSVVALERAGRDAHTHHAPKTVLFVLVLLTRARTELGQKWLQMHALS